MFLQKSYKYLPFLMVFYISVLVTSNIVSTKLTDIWIFTFDAGTILFPLSYIFGDIMTEVYGYKETKKVIWFGFFGVFLMSAIIMLVGLLPPSASWDFQTDYQNILGLTPRIVLGSLIAYLFGEFSNSYILAKIKIKMKGKLLFVRTIASTIFAQFFDTIIFVLIAFSGVFDNEVLLIIIISNYVFKVGIEVLFTPLTYLIVGKLKKEEKVDVYDNKTNFNPFVV